MRRSKGMRKNRRYIVLGLLLICMMAGLSACGKSTDQIVSDARNGVVRVLAIGDDGMSTGSAFGVGKAGKETDIFVTNRHVVVDDYGNEQTEIYILLDSRAIGFKNGNLDLDQNLMVRCDVIYLGDEEYPDIAILKARQPISGRVALPLWESENALVSSKVYALGYPGNSDTPTSSVNASYLLADVADVTVTDGTISRFTKVAQYDNMEVVQITASINHGNSGGALITAEGAVIGITTMSFNYTNITENSIDISKDFFAVKIDYVMDVLDELGIDYDKYSDQGNLYLILGIAGGAVVILVVVLLVAAPKRKKSGSRAKMDTSTANGNAMATPAFTNGSGNAVPLTSSGSDLHDSALRFQGTAGVFAGKRYAINGVVRIGRDPSKNDVVFPANVSGISRVHCALLLQNGQLYLKDLGSTHGTFLGNGQRIAANQAVPLQIGDRFYLGSEKQAFVITGKGGI